MQVPELLKVFQMEALHGQLVVDQVLLNPLETELLLVSELDKDHLSLHQTWLLHQAQEVLLQAQAELEVLQAQVSDQVLPTEETMASESEE